MRTCLYRWYTNGENKVRALQGKIFEVNGKDIFYRDIHKNHSRMWMYGGSFNLDYRTYNFLKDHDIKEIHYYLSDESVLLKTTTRRIANAIERGRAEVKSLNGHRQVFLPKHIFKQTKRNYSVPWIKSETNIADYKNISDYSIPYSVRQRLADDFRSKYL